MSQNTSVCFAIYEPYEPIPIHSVPIGVANINAVMQMMELFESGTLPRGCCLDTLYADLGAHASPRYQSDKQFITQKMATLDLSGFWYSNHPTLHCCNPKSHPRADNAIARCAKNLANGKCKDEFMKRTVGAMLFPQFYAPQHQK